MNQNSLDKLLTPTDMQRESVLFRTESFMNWACAKTTAEDIVTRPQHIDSEDRNRLIRNLGFQVAYFFKGSLGDTIPFFVPMNAHGKLVYSGIEASVMFVTDIRKSRDLYHEDLVVKKKVHFQRQMTANPSFHYDNETGNYVFSMERNSVRVQVIYSAQFKEGKSLSKPESFKIEKIVEEMPKITPSEGIPEVTERISLTATLKDGTFVPELEWTQGDTTLVGKSDGELWLQYKACIGHINYADTVVNMLNMRTMPFKAAVAYSPVAHLFR